MDIRAMVTAGFILAGMMMTGGCSTTPVCKQRMAVCTKQNVGIDMVTSKVLPALVRIEVLMESGGNGRMQKQRGFGSGTIIDKEGHVLTNHHVAGRGTRFLCTLPNREEIPATLVGTDALSDLAIIKLDLAARRNPDAPVSVAEFGDSAALNVGDVVFALGSPAALSQSVTKGIVANTEMIAPPLLLGAMILDGESVGELVRWIGHDAIIFGGNSGGPLVDVNGLIVGVNEVGIGSLGGAIPGNLAKQVAEELIAHGEITRGWIGLEVQPLLREMKASKGALVASVFEGSPAAEAGLQPGDFIEMFNGEAVLDCRSPEDLPVFNAMVLGSKVGSEIKFAGLRDGQAMTWTVQVAQRLPGTGLEREYKTWGMTARGVTPMVALEKKRENRRGLLVHSVSSGGPAGEAKPPLIAGDIVTSVDGHEIESLEDFHAYYEANFADLEERQSVLVAFERGIACERLLTVVKAGPERDPQKPLTVDKGWLGAAVQVLDRELAKALDMNVSGGVRITRISKDSPALTVGLQPGDIITKLDGEALRIHRPEDVRRFDESLGARMPGTEVALEVARGAESLTVHPVLAARPQDEDDADEWKDATFEFTARELTVAVRDSMKLPGDLQAVRIVSVVPNGWASFLGLRESDLILSIDGRAISDVGVLEEELKAAAERLDRRTVVFVQRGIRHLYIEIESPEFTNRNEKESTDERI